MTIFRYNLQSLENSLPKKNTSCPISITPTMIDCDAQTVSAASWTPQGGGMIVMHVCLYQFDMA